MCCNIDTNRISKLRTEFWPKFNSSVAMIKAGTWFHTHNHDVDINRKYKKIPKKFRQITNKFLFVILGGKIMNHQLLIAILMGIISYTVGNYTYKTPNVEGFCPKGWRRIGYICYKWVYYCLYSVLKSVKICKVQFWCTPTAHVPHFSWQL